MIKMPMTYGAMKHMLDHMPVNLLVCDAKTLEITYANRMSHETLRSLSSLLPAQVRDGDIIGQCIDIFHENPSRQRDILARKGSFPHQATIRLGREFLDLRIIHVPGR